MWRVQNLFADNPPGTGDQNPLFSDNPRNKVGPIPLFSDFHNSAAPSELGNLNAIWSEMPLTMDSASPCFAKCRIELEPMSDFSGCKYGLCLKAYTRFPSFLVANMGSNWGIEGHQIASFWFENPGALEPPYSDPKAPKPSIGFRA